MKIFKGNDEKIIAAIRAGGSQGQKAWNSLYAKYRPNAERYAFTLGCVGDDFRDIYQESFVVLIKKIRAKDDKINSGIKKYLLGTVRNAWLQEVAKRKKLRILKERGVENLERSPEQKMISAERKAFIQENLEKLGNPCKDLLNYQAQSYSYKEIAEKMDEIKNEEEVRWRLPKCKKKYRKIMIAHPDFSDLINLKENYG